MRFYAGQEGVLTTVNDQWSMTVSDVDDDFVVLFDKNHRKYYVQNGYLYRGVIGDDKVGLVTGWFPLTGGW